MPNVRSARVAVNVTVPHPSSPLALGSRVSRMRGRPNSSATAPIAAINRKIERQPNEAIKAPANTGPKARPTPKLAPSMLKARIRACPSNSCTSAADPPDNAAAAAMPCTARNRSSQITEGAAFSASELATNSSMPEANTRFRPNWSARVPAAIKRLPKLSMKALVIQVRAIGEPPRSRLMAGVATAPPEKLSGRTMAAIQIAARMRRLPGSVAWFVGGIMAIQAAEDRALPLAKRHADNGFAQAMESPIADK